MEMRVEAERDVPATVALVPHTHWDREWYLPFQRFRLRLVGVLDALLDLLRAHPELCFTLDGQTVVVDDYLELRPEAEPVLRQMIATGRIAIGPWKALPDEFLVSGETLVRNLIAGIGRAEALGGTMRTGYLPDSFGHTAQMPQILRRAGISRSVVWRGVPAEIETHRFRWRAPDGSEVETEYLPRGYGNAAVLFASRENLRDRVDAFVQRMRPFYPEGRPILAMHGTDHFEPLPDLVPLVVALNENHDPPWIEVMTLDAYMDDAPPPAAEPVWRGELRSGARANILMGVTSARMGIKAAAAAAEIVLLRYAEPFTALFGPETVPRALEVAWDRVIVNSAHDSICGCSTDEVAEQVLVRYAEARQIGDELTDRAVTTISGAIPRGCFVVANPLPSPRYDVVELDALVHPSFGEVGVMVDGETFGTQELVRHRTLLYEARVAGRDAAAILRVAHGRELFGRVLNRYRIEESGDGPRLVLEVDVEPDPPSLDVERLYREIESATRARPDETWTVRMESAARRRLLARVPAPALGWTEMQVVNHGAPVEAAVEAGAGSLSNSLVTVALEGAGTVAVEAEGAHVAGALRLVEGGDGGDSYNYAPPRADRVVDDPVAVAVRVLERGPLRGRLEIARTYRWPAGLEGEGRSDAERTVEVLTHVELRAGEPFVRVRVAFDNPCTDHRVRVHVPLARPVVASSAEGGFAVVERGLTAEGGHGEVPLPTFPAGAFVAVDGLSVLLPHVTEYEIVDGREIALTVLRSIGLISRSHHPYREEPAGPETAIPEAQRRGPVELSFALYPHRGGWREARTVAAAEGYRHPLVVGRGRADAGKRESARAEGLRVEGEGVAMTSLRRTARGLELRLVRYGDDPGRAIVTGGFTSADVVDLSGTPLRPAALTGPGRAEVPLSPWEIATLRLIP